MNKHIAEILGTPGRHVSFEVFPPKNRKGLLQIYRTIAGLKKLKPDFFSVTYGAGGSTADRSLEIASAVQNLAGEDCVAHFTCVGMGREQVRSLLSDLKLHGIENVLALRGDPPEGTTQYVKPEDGFSYAKELVEFIRENIDVGILVAGYPEGHQEAKSREEDFKYLVEKVNAGADGIVTQAFFDNSYFFDFKNKLEEAGVTIPILAGIFPISNEKQIRRIIELSGASIPEKLQKGLDKYSGNPENIEKFGTEFAIEQVEELITAKHDFFHFYTMNREKQTRRILLELQQYFPNLDFDN